MNMKQKIKPIKLVFARTFGQILTILTTVFLFYVGIFEWAVIQCLSFIWESNLIMVPITNFIFAPIPSENMFEIGFHCFFQIALLNPIFIFLISPSVGYRKKILRKILAFGMCVLLCAVCFSSYVSQNIGISLNLYVVGTVIVVVFLIGLVTLLIGFITWLIKLVMRV